MKRILKHSTIILAMNVLLVFALTAGDRASEIRETMWNSNDPDFSVRQIPEKWKDESAVIIAQYHGFQYRKPLIVPKLHYNQYRHYRIMLNDKKAVQQYAEISFPAGIRFYNEVYTGIKLIKPDGREIIVDNATAVMMEKEGMQNLSYKKIAVPNLEPGDILDYYICEESEIVLRHKMHYFEPVLYHLPQRYPVMKQKIQFDVQRRCFISLKSLNGAPELQMVYDRENDEQHYSLEDENREALDDTRWFFPYRELPAIKFRAAYASGKAARTNDVLLGEPGTVKRSVSKKELTDFLAYIIANTYTDGKDIVKYVKRNTDKNSDYFTKAKAGYYFQRNRYLTHNEALMLAGDTDLTKFYTIEKDNAFEFIDRLGTHFLTDMDIPFDIVIVVPRSISSLDDMLIEHELRFLLRVKQGDEYLYLSQIDNFSMPGDIDALLEGADAYVVDGQEKYKRWAPKRITLPVSTSLDNAEATVMEVKVGEDFEQTELSIHKSISGKLKSFYQNQLLDIYDYIEPERKKFDMKEGFYGTRGMKKKLENLKSSYLSTRDRNRNDLLKFMLEETYSFQINETSGFTMEQAGRFETSPELKYRFNATVTGLVHKVGPNYTMDVGKLIEKQVKISEEEINRENNVYMEHPRAYRYRILINIPEGYEVQGLKNLNMQSENDHGGFKSTARIENNKIIIETYKHYDKIFVPTEDWPVVVDFLNQASNFSEQKILFKKRDAS